MCQKEKGEYVPCCQVTQKSQDWTISVTFGNMEIIGVIGGSESHAK